MFYQEAPLPPSVSRTVMERVFEFLNYPFLKHNNFQVSFASLLLFALAIFLAFTISRVIRSMLEKRVLSRFPHVDTGMRYTLLRTLHYLIITLGVLYGLKLGIGADLTGIAVILGFLSVGIGFGLQAITSDVISGFILLFERPLRVGDYLKLGDMEGRVSQINLRSTMVLTNDKVTVIVPNSELVKNKVINWSYSPQIRIKVAVEIESDGDIDTAPAVMARAAKGVAHVLEEPPPSVHFLGTGDSSYKFELLVWIDAPHNHSQIRSDLNRSIQRMFRDASIQIPTVKHHLYLQDRGLKLSRKAKKKRDGGHDLPVRLPVEAASEAQPGEKEISGPTAGERPLS